MMVCHVYIGELLQYSDRVLVTITFAVVSPTKY